MRVQIRLLRSCLEEMGEEERAPWLRELAALLFHLVRRSQLVVRLLTAEIGTLAALLTTSTDPLTLSLGELPVVYHPWQQLVPHHLVVGACHWSQ